MRVVGSLVLLVLVVAAFVVWLRGRALPGADRDLAVIAQLEAAGSDLSKPHRSRDASHMPIWSIAYALLVFAGANLLGFVAAPELGAASGAFPIDTDARAFFSLVTLKGEPYLFVLASASGVLHHALLRSRRTVSLALAWCGNVLVAWVISGACVLALYG